MIIYLCLCFLKLINSFVIKCSGESGSGKSETAKLCIKQLVSLSSCNSELERQIMQVYLLLCYECLQ